MSPKHFYVTLFACLFLLCSGGALSSVQAQIPPNDECRNAISIFDGNTYQGNIKSASPDNAPFCVVANNLPGVWYKCTGTGQPVTISLCNAAGFDSKISVFSGMCGRFTCVTGNDDSPGCSGFTSEVNFNTRTGMDYYILVHGDPRFSGAFTMTVGQARQAAPNNDECTNATPISCGDTVTASTFEATVDVTAPSCPLRVGPAISVTSPGVWYSFVGTGDFVQLNTCGGSNFDTKLSVYEGGCGGLTCVTANDDFFGCGSNLQSQVDFCSEPGVTYHVLVHGSNVVAGSDTGTFTLAYNCFPRPVNDDVCNAIPAVINGVVPFDTRYACADPNEVSPGGGSTASSCNAQDGWCDFEIFVNNSVWFTVVVPPSGCVRVLANGFGSTDTQLAIWRVGDCSDYSTFQELAANDDSGDFFDPPGSTQSGAINFLPCLVPGEIIYIQVDVFEDREGLGELTVIDCGGFPLEIDGGGCQTRFVNFEPVAGDTNYLWASANGGYEPYTLIWQGDSTVLYENPDSSAIAVLPTVTTDYVAMVIDSAGCMASDTATVVVEDLICDTTQNEPIVTMCCRVGSGGLPVYVDFNTDSDGNSLFAGQVINDEYIDDGITISAVSNGNYDIPIIFDSSNPTGGDPDLGTPNQAFNGPGVGIGGVTNNSVALGNLLIIAENDFDINADNLIDNPDDESAGGTIIIEFECPVTVDSITLVDMDDGTISGNTMTCFGPNGMASFPIFGFGDNSVNTLAVEQEQVEKMEIYFKGSGALAGFQYSSEGGALCVDSTNVDSLLSKDGNVTYTFGSCTNVCTDTNRYVPVPVQCEDFNVQIMGDVFAPSETTWELQDLTTGEFVQPLIPVQGLVTEDYTFCVNPTHCYEFTILDFNGIFGDGFFGGGWYQLSFLGDTIFSNFFDPLIFPYDIETQRLGTNCPGSKKGASSASLGSQAVHFTAYPNPFTDRTKLRFFLPEADHASLTAYDMTGKPIQVLFDEAVGGGQMVETEWDGSNLPAGLYIMVLETESGRVQHLKMSIQR